MEDRLAIGLVSGGVETPLGLAWAAARHPDVSVVPIAADEPSSAGLVGLIVDEPVEQRATLVNQVARRWQLPILVQSPIGVGIGAVRGQVGLDHDNLIVVANPLRYALHTRRLIEELQAGEDPVQTFFGAWRFAAPSDWQPALPQMLDYLRALCPGRVRRLSAMSRRDPSVLSVTMRYASGALGSLEIGQHLPIGFPVSSELIVECFCRERSYQCLPGSQAISVEGRIHHQYDWQPEPADAIVSSFVQWLRGGQRPVGDLRSDLAAILLSERILTAARSGDVLVLDEMNDA